VIKQALAAAGVEFIEGNGGGEGVRSGSRKTEIKYGRSSSFRRTRQDHRRESIEAPRFIPSKDDPTAASRSGGGNSL
jgi:hypothetical protein